MTYLVVTLDFVALSASNAGQTSITVDQSIITLTGSALTATGVTFNGGSMTVSHSDVSYFDFTLLAGVTYQWEGTITEFAEGDVYFASYGSAFR